MYRREEVAQVHLTVLHKNVPNKNNINKNFELCNNQPEVVVHTNIMAIWFMFLKNQITLSCPNLVVMWTFL